MRLEIKVDSFKAEHSRYDIDLEIEVNNADVILKAISDDDLPLDDMVKRLCTHYGISEVLDEIRGRYEKDTNAWVNDNYEDED